MINFTKKVTRLGLFHVFCLTVSEGWLYRTPPCIFVVNMLCTVFLRKSRFMLTIRSLIKYFQFPNHAFLFHENRNDVFLLVFFCFYYRIKLHSIKLFVLLHMNPFFQMCDKFLALMISRVNLHTCVRVILALVIARQLSLVITRQRYMGTVLNWPNIIVWLPLLFEILGNMCTAIC